MVHQQQGTLRQKIRQGKMSGMAVWLSKDRDHHRGLIVSRGRIPSEAMERLTGQPFLPVLLGSTRLSELIIRQIHYRSHRKEIGALLATSRREVWITDGRRLARRIVKSCVACKKYDKKRESQRMGHLSERLLERVRPFQVTGLDLMGPLRVGVGAGRKKHAVKHWAAVYACLSTGAVAVWLLEDYSADAFLQGHTSHISVYGQPSSITTDQGSQIVAGARQDGLLNWDTVQHATASQGTVWNFVPPATPWRNGKAERLIALLKQTLSHQVEKGKLLSPLQLQTFLHKAAAILNERPLTV